MGDVPEALFVGWRQGDAQPIGANDLQSLFDQATAPWMSSSASLESSHVADALLRRKGPLAGRMAPEFDDIVVLRLTRLARSPEVETLLFESPFLADCRAHVVAAGSEIAPAWANGAKLFVPMTLEQVVEAGLELQHHHILVYECDVD